MQRQTFRAMGSEMMVALETTTAATAVLAAVPHWFAQWEQILSRFRSDSELTRLNQQSGTGVRVSSVLWDVLQVALDAARWSDGLVQPTLLAALEVAGYQDSMEGHAWGQEMRSQSGERVPPALDQWRAIRCNPVDQTVWLPPGLRLDLGGIAKGWAADQTARRLQGYGPVLVDAGGDIALPVARLHGQTWPVGVADPAHPDRLLGCLCLDHGAVASSGRDYRRWQRNGQWQHHIIDPRTAQPAQTDVLSATVVGPSATAAEVAAKMVLILGSRAGLAWLDAHPAFAGLLVLEDDTIRYSERIHTHLWKGNTSATA
ncbi:MAG: FAD:protein FMN transferase [Chloroflexaceae bacterium]|nr:FAD:protein FMN transferase [Chloroflexaceae bacterium]